MTDQNQQQKTEGPFSPPFHASLVLIAGLALFLWGLAVSLGTGIGYDRPVDGLFDGGLRSLWRLAKAGFLFLLAWETARAGIDMLERGRTAGRRNRRNQIRSLEQ
jgi:hypothetical protein